jgi:hypothetical protein
MRPVRRKEHAINAPQGTNPSTRLTMLQRGWKSIYVSLAEQSCTLRNKQSKEFLRPAGFGLLLGWCLAGIHSANVKD